MLPSSWKPIAAKELSRMGPPNDGGYVVSDRAVRDSDLLLSMGLNHDWRFEEAFLEETNARIICFDGSVDRRFWQLWTLKKLVQLKLLEALHYFAYRHFFRPGHAEHRLLMVGYDRKGSVSLSTILKDIKSTRIFLKCDIEGWEFRIFDDLVRFKDRFSCIVMEIHNLDLNRDRVSDFLDRMIGFSVVHLTPNNGAGVDREGDPIVVEITLVADKYLGLSTQDGSGIAQVLNNPNMPAIKIQFA